MYIYVYLFIYYYTKLYGAIIICPLYTYIHIYIYTYLLIYILNKFIQITVSLFLTELLYIKTNFIGHTRYSLNLNEDQKLIQHLWEMLNELDASDRIRFVKFCWGQERLPENDEAFERNHIRFMIKPNMDKKKN